MAAHKDESRKDAQPKDEQAQVARRPEDSAAADELWQGSQTLEELEKTVTISRRSWGPTGRALDRIKRDGLYLNKCGGDWERYVFEMWGFTARHADDLIRAYPVAKNIASVRDHALRLSGALRLAKLPADKQAAALCEAIAASRSRSPSAKQISQAVARLAEGKPKRRRQAKPKPEKHNVPGLGKITIFPGMKKMLLVVAAGKAAGDHQLERLARVALDRLTMPPQADAA